MLAAQGAVLTLTSQHEALGAVSISSDLEVAEMTLSQHALRWPITAAVLQEVRRLRLSIDLGSLTCTPRLNLEM